MRGAGVEILVGPKLLFAVENQDRHTWCLSKAWLSHHSGLFKRACEGYLLKTNRIMIDNDPDIFELFVEFMLRGQYTYRDDLRVHTGIRESAKAWALGEYLEAPKFQNFAMYNLWKIYSRRPRSGICPEAIEYICETVESDSPLYQFFRDVTVTYWSERNVVSNGVEYTKHWNNLFKAYPTFCDDLLMKLGEGGNQIKTLTEYLVPEVTESESSIPDTPSSTYDDGFVVPDNSPWRVRIH